MAKQGESNDGKVKQRNRLNFKKSIMYYFKELCQVKLILFTPKSQIMHLF